MIHVIKTQISNHPLITQTELGTPVKRFVQFTGYASFKLLIQYVVLEFLVTLESPDGNVISTPTHLEYKLHTDIWFNAQAQIVPHMIADPNSTEEEPLPNIVNPDAIITEYDYWLGQMINVAVPDGALIALGIQNLDQNFQFFNQI